MNHRIHQTLVEILKGDITEATTDAIVNAANSQLAHGGGVAGAIVRKGGPIIQEESDTWVFARGPVPPGQVAITSGGRLQARYVIHAVGPRMGEGDEDQKLREAVLNSLKTAEKHGLRSLAFPAISTGIFGYPANRCADIMLQTVMDYAGGETRLERILFFLFDDEILSLFQKTFRDKTARMKSR